MNEIEKLFYNKFVKKLTEDEADVNLIKPQVSCGIYVVDFIFSESIAIEIDGHEYHKTKEQREKDYKKQRYLQKNGYIVVRFMGTEVFINTESCIDEVREISDVFNEINIKNYEIGYKSGVSND